MLEKFMVDYGASVLGGAFFFLVAWIFSLWLGRAANHVFLRQMQLDPSVAGVFSQILRITIVILAFIVVLDQLGLDIASLIAALGIFGFAVAIGLRPTSVNFFAGVMLLLIKPYKVGDHIEGDKVEGVVESISLFHTVVVTPDGSYVSVPNGPMWSKAIKNLSRVRPKRVELDVTVERQLPFEALNTVIERVVRADADVFSLFPPEIRIIDAKENSMVIRVAFSCDAESAWDVQTRVSGKLQDEIAAAGATVSRIAAPKKPKPDKKKQKSEPAEDD